MTFFCNKVTAFDRILKVSTNQLVCETLDLKVPSLELKPIGAIQKLKVASINFFLVVIKLAPRRQVVIVDEDINISGCS